MYCRNQDSKDGEVSLRPCNLDSGNPCRNDELLAFMRLPWLRQTYTGVDYAFFGCKN